MSPDNVFIARSTKTGAVVANIAKTQNRTTGKFFKSIIAAAALSTCAMAQADVTLNFEGDAAGLYFAGSQEYIDNYWLETYGGTQTNDLAGLIIDGSNPYACDTIISCPVNNKSKYLALFDDSYAYFGLADDSRFKLTSLQASFIGAGQATYPATAGLLVLQGFNADGSLAGGALQLGLAGPTNGAFNFATYNTGAFGGQLMSYVRVLGYTCDTGGSCNRSANLANFALDNIVTVPEPTTLALLGLGLAGFGVSRRRRA